MLSPSAAERGPCTGKDPAETASEDGVVNATSGSDGLGGEGAPLLCAESLHHVDSGEIAGAALYLGLVSSAKVEPGGADGDAGSNLEGAEVDMETALAFGGVGRAGPEIEALGVHRSLDQSSRRSSCRCRIGARSSSVVNCRASLGTHVALCAALSLARALF